LLDEDVVFQAGESPVRVPQPRSNEPRSSGAKRKKQVETVSPTKKAAEKKKNRVERRDAGRIFVL
jgi:hypothetical protein